MAKKRSVRFSPKLQTRKSVVTGPRKVVQIGRNEPCPCGSGKKYKDCHAGEGDAFLVRLGKEKRKQEITAYRQKLKDQGVPWYRRILIR